MAAVIVRQNLKKEEVKEASEIEREEQRHRRPFATAFLLVFVAEWGDLTQLATAALQARYRDALTVFASATIALWAVAAIAVVLGNRLGAWIPQRPLQFAAAGVMVLAAIALISGILGQHPDAGVAHVDAQLRPLALRRHPDAAGFGELDGVTQQVQQHLLELWTVGKDPPHLGGNAGAKLQPLGLRQRADAFDALRNQGLDVDFAAVQLRLPRLQFRDVEQVVDQRQQVLTVLGDDVDVLPLLTGEDSPVPFEHQLGESEDRVQRRA